ncbi:LysR family transcriptional regulator [Janthinobacterium lividum]|uniref:LysR family transcriptional regulator n=1 Tax=Janthinobacterium lividum TaxID=29581 RepID=UPI00140BE87B|nr:LysR family transcriptional regulator [Janthinobacterium lividum]NHQ89182.1 LysR family transcriptional regulator [Janthinobacterium lividum]
MISLDRLGIFIAIVDAGSLTAAAAVLGQSKAVVSFNLKQLEAELGVSLLTRSTRSLALTDVGRRFYEDCQRVLSEAQGAIETARQGHQGLRGTLRLTTTVEYGGRTVIPALIAFAAAHPQLQIQHSSSSSHEDLISGRYDLAIRMGSLNDSSYRAALIEPYAIWPVASPAYLASLPAKGITSLDDLQRARWLAHSRLAAPLRWDVHTPDGAAAFAVQDDAAIQSDSASALLGFALGGCGVALLPQWQVEAEVRAGRLRRLLPDVVFPEQGVYAVYPNTQHIAEKVRAFIDFLRAFVGTPD